MGWGAALYVEREFNIATIMCGRTNKNIMVNLVSLL